MDLRQFQQCVCEAPALLAVLSDLLQECVQRELLLPAGIRNLCALPWEELSALPPDAKPLHQSRGLCRTPRPSGPCPAPAPPDTHRLSTGTSHSLLAADSSLSFRPRPSVVKLKKRFNDRDANATCIPVTSTIRLYLEECLSQLSFSLTYKEAMCSPSILRLSSSTLDVCLWAVQKLRPILKQMQQERSGSEVSVVTQHYREPVRVRPAPPTNTPTTDLLFPTIPSTKYLSYSLPLKLHYGLPDKTCFLYYPSGSVCVCQVPSAEGAGGVYTSVFSDGPYDNLLACFLPSGRGFIYHSGKPSWLSVLVGIAGGQELSREGSLTREWALNTKAQQQVLHKYKVNENVSVTISNHTSLNFSALNESITLSLREANMPVSSEGTESVRARQGEINAYMEELQALRRRVKETAIGWLTFYLTATGLTDAPKPRALKRKEAWTASPRVHLTTEEVPLPYVRPASLRRKIARPSTCCLPIRATPTYRPASHSRARSARLPCVSAPLPSEAPPSPCPAVLRLVACGASEGQVCRCSTRLPLVTDLELGELLQARGSPPGHVLVLYVTSSLRPIMSSRSSVEPELQRLHHQQVHTSATPCTKSSQDPFRLMKYDIDTATHLTHTPQPLLVQRHNVGPGTLLMYVGGRLVYGGSVLNGYGFSKSNLLKQISKAQRDYSKGSVLPHDYKLGVGSPRWALQGHNDADRHEEGRPARNPTSCRHEKGRHVRTPTSCSSNREKSEGLTRCGGISALDFVVSHMTDRSAILAMQSRRRGLRPAPP